MLTVVVGLPILIVIINLGGIWLRAGLLILSLIGLYEFYNALSKKVLAIHFTGYIYTCLYYLLEVGDFGSISYSLTRIAAFILFTIAMLVIFYNKITLNDCLVTISGFFYVTFLLSFIYFVRDHSLYFVWLIFTSASASDTFAFLIGRKWGRHKLTNTPSPGKSWEGCIAGVLGAAFVGFLYGLLVSHFFETQHLTVFNAMAVSVMGAIFSQFGDLFASAIKRSVGIKDFGKILPGHGGVLDRFDSIIVAAPIVYMVMVGMGYLV